MRPSSLVKFTLGVYVKDLEAIKLYTNKYCNK